jgi:hypothetical protein
MVLMLCASSSVFALLCFMAIGPENTLLLFAMFCQSIASMLGIETQVSIGEELTYCTEDLRDIMADYQLQYAMPSNAKHKFDLGDNDPRSVIDSFPFGM